MQPRAGLDLARLRRRGRGDDGDARGGGAREHDRERHGKRRRRGAGERAGDAGGAGVRGGAGGRGVGVGAAGARVLRGDGDGDGDRLAVRRGRAVGVEFRRGDREELRGVLARIAPGVVRVRGERVRAGVVAGAGVDAAHRVRGRRGDGVTRAGVPVLSKDGVRCGRAGVRDEREHEFGVRGERDVRAVEKKSERMVSRTRRGFGGAQRRVRVEGVL